jgi:hypothetical protein
MVPNNPLQVDEDSIQTETFDVHIGRFKLYVVKYQGEIFIPEHKGLKVIERRTSWLILWKYFCNRGSTKAASLLRCPATHGLEHHQVA